MNCYLCGSAKNFQRIGKVREDDTIRILECNCCGLVFLDRILTTDEFYKNNGMLDGNFFKLTQRSQGEEDTLKDDILAHENDWNIMTRKRFEILKHILIGKEVLDFGSGHGQFLIMIKNIVKRCCGIEIEEQVKNIYKENQIELFASISDLQKTGRFLNGFDIVTSAHVMEHLRDPISVLRELKELIKDNGKIIIEVPNANDALLTIYQSNAFQNFSYQAGHLFLFNPNTLKILGEKAGLKVDFIKCIQRYPLSNTLYWLANGLPAGQKQWGGFIDNPILQNAYEQTLASLGATDTLIAQFSKI
ncbi:class I SAM-dependent methyltransferase [Campylobacter lari]|uniref:class I SAM-dependent methyltransferase n=1 Tax=Campylobacter lari TaxID=201 RepID=UPI00372AD145